MKIKANGQPIGRIQCAYNLTFGPVACRLFDVQYMLRAQLRCSPQGKGNHAWKRLDAMRRSAVFESSNFVLYP